MRRRCKIRLCPILPKKMRRVRIKRSLPLIFHLSMKRICAAHGITNLWTSARCTLHLEHCSLLIAHYNWSVHFAHCALLGAQRNGHLSSCGQLWKHCSTWPSVASAASARINTSDQPTTNLRPTATKRWPQPTIYHNLLVLYINTITNTSKNHTPDSYKNIKLGMIWRISWTDDEYHLHLDVSRISSLDEHARLFVSNFHWVLAPIAKG